MAGQELVQLERAIAQTDHRLAHLQALLFVARARRSEDDIEWLVEQIRAVENQLAKLEAEQARLEQASLAWPGAA